MIKHPLVRRYGHIILLLPFLFTNLCFFLLEHIIRKPDYYMRSLLDMRIPFVPVFVVPYTLWYIYIAGTLVFLFFRSRQEFSRLAIFLSGGMAIACVVYALFPNGQLLRPLWLDDDIFSSMVRTIYRKDTPINSLPSIHVIYSIGVHLAIAHYPSRWRHYKAVRLSSFVLMVLICLSTVFVKQHSVLDVYAGVGVSALLYGLIYRLPQVQESRSMHKLAA